MTPHPSPLGGGTSRPPTEMLQRDIAQLREWEALRKQLRPLAESVKSVASPRSSLNKVAENKLIVVMPYLPFIAYFQAPTEISSSTGSSSVVSSNSLLIDLPSDDDSCWKILDDSMTTNFAKYFVSLQKDADNSAQEIVILGALKISVSNRLNQNIVLMDSHPFASFLSSEVESYCQRTWGNSCSGCRVRPVILPSSSSSLLPNDYAESILYPLLHYATSIPLQLTREKLHVWEDFKNLNSLFTASVLQVYSVGDIISIHGHPLILLPQMLRAVHSDIIIGFYLFSVFPSSEVYRVLPQREDLLRGLLGANVVAFHNFLYARHFLTSCTRILGVECTSSAVLPCEEAGGGSTSVVSVPMGIDSEPLLDCLQKSDVKYRISCLKQMFSGVKVILAIDSLNEMRGLTHKLLAFQKLLRDRPDWANHQVQQSCVLVQVCLINAEEAEDLASSLTRKSILERAFQIVGEINSTFGTVEYVPVHFLYKRMTVQELVPLYAIANVFLDTALRDVMSERSFEFLCCNDGSGVLVLSEFSGSAISLRACAITVNPWDVAGFSEALHEALSLDEQDLAERFRYGWNMVRGYTSREWARRYLQDIRDASEICETEGLVMRPMLNHDIPVEALRSCRGNRLIVIGLVNALSVVSSKVSVLGGALEYSDHMIQHLGTLSRQPNTDMILLSNASIDVLDTLLPFNEINAYVLAESGSFLRDPNDPAASWVARVNGGVDVSWMDAVEKIMDDFVCRTPGSYTEKSSYSLSWIFPKTQQDYGSVQSKELMIHLWAGPLLTSPAEVVSGVNFVEVRAVAVNPTQQLDRLLTDLDRSSFEFVFCVGDFLTKDEEIYGVVSKFSSDPANAQMFCTCTVGKKISRASWAVRDAQDFAFLTAKLAWATTRGSRISSTG